MQFKIFFPIYGWLGNIQLSMHVVAYVVKYVCSTLITVVFCIPLPFKSFCSVRTCGLPSVSLTDKPVITGMGDTGGALLQATPFNL